MMNVEDHKPLWERILYCQPVQYMIHPLSYISSSEWFPCLQGVVEDEMFNGDGQRGLCETDSTLKVMQLADEYGNE